MAKGAALALVAAALTACGGADRDPGAGGPDRASASRAYAERVASSTELARGRLATIADGADYRDAASAASSTRGYAAAIRQAATGLEAAEPPAWIAGRHRELVTLYRETADRMDVLAAEFEAAGDPAALAKAAQGLSGEVQRYSTRENALRTAIEQALAATTPPAAG